MRIHDECQTRRALAGVAPDRPGPRRGRARSCAVAGSIAAAVALAACVDSRPLNPGLDASGTAGAGGSGGGGGADAATEGAGTGGGGGGDAGASCHCGDLTPYRACCGDRCANLKGDPFNCGKCGLACPAGKPFCQEGSCTEPPCHVASCAAGSCCGGSCCEPGQLCCSVPGPVGDAILCHTPTPGGTCPLGCAPLCMSDRNIKRFIGPVNPEQVLQKIERLRIWTWTDGSDGEAVRHMGPSARDFSQTFGLGESDRAYHAIDAHGTALAAIQALGRLADQRQRRVGDLERKNQELERRVRALEHSRASRVGER
jgi:hypothetical protein